MQLRDHSGYLGQRNTYQTTIYYLLTTHLIKNLPVTHCILHFQVCFAFARENARKRNTTGHAGTAFHNAFIGA